MPLVLLERLHVAILEILDCSEDSGLSSDLYATTYRVDSASPSPNLEVWVEALGLGENLPTMPLWISEDLAVPLDLEASYEATCRSLRIPVEH